MGIEEEDRAALKTLLSVRVGSARSFTRVDFGRTP